jgi:hypothetical protein
MDTAKDLGWAWLDHVIGPIDAACEHAAREQPSEQERPSLEFLE